MEEVMNNRKERIVLGNNGRQIKSKQEKVGQEEDDILKGFKKVKMDKKKVQKKNEELEQLEDPY